MLINAYAARENQWNLLIPMWFSKHTFAMKIVEMYFGPSKSVSVAKPKMPQESFKSQEVDS